MTITMTKREKIFGWIFLAMTPIVLPMLIVSICTLLPVQLDDAQLNCLVFAVNFLLTGLIFHRFLLQNAAQSLQAPKRTFRWFGLGLAVYGGGNFLVSLLVQVLAKDFSNANDANISSMMQDHFWLMALCIVVLVPITEEVLYRGLVFGLLRQKCRWAAYVVSVCAFSALHVVGYIGTMPPLHLVISFLQYLPGAFALAFAYDQSDCIWTSILIHSTINTLAVIAMR